jgi:sporulation protein YqfC
MSKFDGIVDFIDIPRDTLFSLPALHLTSDRRLYIENHRGVQNYSAEKLVINTKIGFIEITGKSLELKEFSKDSLLVVGSIRSILLPEQSGSGR